MPYAGYLNFGGNEIVNSPRSFGYSITSDCPVAWLKPNECDDTLPEALQEELPYTWANIADAPWYDIDLPDVSSRFYGVYGIDFLNLPDSTRKVPIVEHVGDGGSVGQSRLATKEVRVRAWLTAQGDDAMEYGRAWLDAALSPGACGQHGTQCGLTDLAFYADCPPERGTVPVYTDWETIGRNYYPDPRATALTTFFSNGGTLSLVTDYPDPMVTTAVRATRAAAGSSRMLDMKFGAAAWAVSTQYRVRFEITVSAATTLTIALRPDVASATNSVTLAAPVLAAGAYSIDVSGVSAAAGAGTAASGITLIANGDAVGTMFTVTKIIVEHAPLFTDGDFFDGNTPDEDLQRYEWEGTVNASPSIRQNRSSSTGPEPMPDYLARLAVLTRYLHGVAVTSGPLTVQKAVSTSGAIGHLVEWVFTATRPWVFGATRELTLPTSQSTVVQDIPYNLVPYPSAELAAATFDVVTATNYSANPSVETDATAWTASGLATSGANPSTYLTSGRSTDLAAVGTASFRARILGNSVTEVAAAVARVTSQQDVTLPAGTGRRVSVNVWAGAIIAAGAAVSSIQNVVTQGQFLDAANAAVGAVVPIGTAAASERNGRAYSLKSIPVPATATKFRVQAVFDVGWRSSATAANNSDVRMYVDALAVTVP